MIRARSWFAIYGFGPHVGNRRHRVSHVQAWTVQLNHHQSAARGRVSHDKHKEKWGALWVVARVSPIDNWFIN
jgi:hypothetical protein